jgi:hypothetical protein
MPSRSYRSSRSPWTLNTSVSIRSARSSRQAAINRRRVSTLCSPPSGAMSRNSNAASASNSSGFSSSSRALLLVRRPCRSAFLATRALPAALTGPRDFAPLRRLASARAGARLMLMAMFLACGGRGEQWSPQRQQLTSK